MNYAGRFKQIEHVAIIGAGFSGALQAINLLRHEGPRATLIERHPEIGKGVAYSAAHPDHLLNVRAGNMSALPDDSDHFVRWMAANGVGSVDGFVPRITYGDYLSDLLGEASLRGGDRLAVRAGEAVDIRFDPHQATVILADGTEIGADTVILAPGNLPPHAPPQLADAGLPAELYVADPWAGDIADGLGDDDVVLVLGTGLTMVDVALLLDARGFRGRIVALSRRGLLPRPHVDSSAPAVSRLAERPTLRPSALLRFVRERAALIGWRAAVDELRPFTQDLWLAAPPAARGRFLRHLRPWWDVHRHRIAPAVARRIDAMRRDGRLEIMAGRLDGLKSHGDRATVSWCPRGSDAPREIDVRRIINCTGPQGDLLRTTEPLLRRLLEGGHIRPDGLRLGIDVNKQAETIGADGRPNPRLLALGPMTRGVFWEIVAVPDIRMQTWSVARQLSNAHWVEGEGL